MDLTAAEIRNINIIQIMLEEAEERGEEIEEPPFESRTWSEEQIRAYFNKASISESDAQSAGCADNGRAVPGAPVKPARRFPPPGKEEFRRWFPGLALSRTACDAPKLRVLCFPSAGNAEDMYTSEGTGVRRAPSPLLDWCRANAAECLAVQYPGRAMRGKDPMISSAKGMAAALLPVVASRLQELPYVVVSHSVGCWVSYEFLVAARQQGLPMPRHAFLSAMASPDIPEAEKPWRPQAGLDEEEFKDECRGWDVNELVFSAALWPVYHSLMRSDFSMFDEYQFTHAGESPLDFPLTLFWGSKDRRITPAMVEGWRNFTSKGATVNKVEGNHLWPLDKNAKQAWLEHVAQTLPSIA